MRSSGFLFYQVGQQAREPSSPPGAPYSERDAGIAQAAFLVAAFFEAGFFAGAFFTATFFTAAFLATAFGAAAFFAGAFFAATVLGAAALMVAFFAALGAAAFFTVAAFAIVVSLSIDAESVRISSDEKRMLKTNSFVDYVFLFRLCCPRLSPFSVA